MTDRERLQALEAAVIGLVGVLIEVGDRRIRQHPQFENVVMLLGALGSERRPGAGPS